MSTPFRYLWSDVCGSPQVSSSGLLLDISGERWRPLAQAAVHLLGHCLQTCPPSAAALVTPQIVSNMAALLQHGATDSRKAGSGLLQTGYDVLRLLAMEMDPSLFPVEDVFEALLLSLSSRKTTSPTRYVYSYSQPT